MTEWTPKNRMLAAYRGIEADRPPVAPELWYYYPAKLLGVDMVEFELEVPFHTALKHAFEYFSCEGWGVVFAPVPCERGERKTTERWIDDDNLERVSTVSCGEIELTSRQRFCRSEPSWTTERPVKNLDTDLPAWTDVFFSGDIGRVDVSMIETALADVGDSFLLEGWLGVPFFDWWGGFRGGDVLSGFEQTVYDFCNPELEPLLQKYQELYIDYLVRLAARLCTYTSLDSLCIGCSWSCNSLEGPLLWRRWDKPVISAVADEVHAHGKLLHIHVHGKCMETVEDFVDTGVDCVCPFERPPGGDIDGRDGLKKVSDILDSRVTMNGNVHTVETLIRGSEAGVRNEVNEILDVFGSSNRLIVGTGDQVGRETPEKNLRAMVDAVKSGSHSRRAAGSF